MDLISLATDGRWVSGFIASIKQPETSQVLHTYDDEDHYVKAYKRSCKMMEF